MARICIWGVLPSGTPVLIVKLAIWLFSQSNILQCLTMNMYNLSYMLRDKYRDLHVFNKRGVASNEYGGEYDTTAHGLWVHALVT